MYSARRWRPLSAMVVTVLAVVAGAVPASTALASQVARAAPAAVSSGCAAPAAGQVTCAALAAPGSAPVGALAAGTPPAGLSPANLQDAYGFQSSTAGTRQTVAVVVPYDDPEAETDLATYRSEFSIPPCTTADGCFSKVNETGGTSYPAASPVWGQTVATSLDMISAVCPNCHILLVEGNTPGIADLGPAADEAIALGARFVTNAWLTPETTLGTGEPAADSQYFDHPGVVMTAPAGNTGYGTSYPAASPDVIAVGGTTLTASSGSARGWTETAWSYSGGGCSPYEAKPSWQADTGCTTRMLNDISAVADPGTPIAAYNTDDTGPGGWEALAGTTVGSAIIAAAYALAGTPASGSSPGSYPYAHTGLINDITTGSDGTCTPAPSYYCTAGAGYDGPTGVGTPASATPLSSSGTSPAGLIRSGIAGKCADNYLGGTANYNKIDIYGCNGSGPQRWTVEADGTIRIQGKCLDNRGNVNANKNTVDLYDCIGSPAQQWRVRYPNALENPSTGKCLDDPGSTTTDTTQLDIYTCNQSAAQQWTLPYPAPASAGEITSGVPAPGATSSGGECLDNLRGFSTDGNKVDIWTCNGGAGSQVWTAGADSTIQIAGKCLDNTGDGAANGNLAELYTCNGHDSQLWLARSDGSLFNPETGKCLDDHNSSTVNGTQIVIWTCNEGQNQEWALPS